MKPNDMTPTPQAIQAANDICEYFREFYPECVDDVAKIIDRHMPLTGLVRDVKAWGEAKGITGPNGKGTLLGQLTKSQEELTETRDAAVMLQFFDFNESNCDDDTILGFKVAEHELKDGIGDTTVTLILAAEMAGLNFADCLQMAYAEIAGRTGTMVNGVFVKEVQP